MLEIRKIFTILLSLYYYNSYYDVYKDMPSLKVVVMFYKRTRISVFGAFGAFGHFYLFCIFYLFLTIYSELILDLQQGTIIPTCPVISFF